MRAVFFSKLLDACLSASRFYDGVMVFDVFIQSGVEHRGKIGFSAFFSKERLLYHRLFELNFSHRQAHIGNGL
jgi:hypothetical protein